MVGTLIASTRGMPPPAPVSLIGFNAYEVSFVVPSWSPTLTNPGSVHESLPIVPVAPHYIEDRSVTKQSRRGAS